MSSWEAPRDWNNYRSATEYNNHHGKEFLRTHLEQQVNPYPRNLEIRCHSSLQGGGWKKVKKPVVWRNNDKGFACRIVTRDEMRNTYTIIVFGSDRSYKDSFQESSVPREFIHFVDAPYSTDMHLQHAFRQPMTLPNDLLPEAWKNVD